MPISLGSAPTIWASDTNFSSGPNTGTPTRVNPGSGYFAQGWIPGQTVPGQYANYLFGELTDYLAAIRTAVNGKAWSVEGGTHTLTAKLTVAGNDLQINTNLIIPSGADIEVENGGDIILASGADLAVGSGAAIEVQAGALLQVDGGLQVTSTGSVSIDDFGTLAAGSGQFVMVGEFDVANLANINVLDGGSIRVEENGQIIVATNALVSMALPENLEIASHSQTFRLCMTPHWIEQVSDVDMWQRDPADVSLLLVQTNVTASYKVAFALPLTGGDVLNSITMRIDGNAGGTGHASTLPGTKPKIELFQVDTDGAMTSLGVETDAPADATAYDLTHSVTLDSSSSGSMLPHTLNGTSAYIIVISGESGGGAQSDALGIRSIFGNVTAKGYRGNADILP